MKNKFLAIAAMVALSVGLFAAINYNTPAGEACCSMSAEATSCDDDGTCCGMPCPINCCK